MRHVAPSTVRRLSLYLHFLEGRGNGAAWTVSSRALAEAGGATPAQARKDLSLFGSFGRRGVGYPAGALAEQLRGILGLDRGYRVVLVGGGRLGAALTHFEGLRDRGFAVSAVYDADGGKAGSALDGHLVRDVASLEADLAGAPADIGVIAVPAAAAQAVADRLVKAGVRALLNFAPVTVTAPAGVAVKHADLALELDGLAYALAHRGS